MVKRTDLNESLMIRSHGVAVRLLSNSPDALDAIVPILSYEIPFSEFVRDCDEDPDVEFVYVWNKSRLDGVYKDGEKISVRRRRNEALQLLASQIRLAVAEYAPSLVFIHAGVVAVNGNAILLPAKSLSGKTTLTAELIKLGALYLSDEYAVIDENGRVCPYPKDLSMRSEGEFQQVEVPVGEFGGKQGTEPLPVKLIVITEFSTNGRWSPKRLSPGQGFLELIPHTVPIRHSPQMSVERLRSIVAGSTIIRSRRGDAAKTAVKIFEIIKSLGG